MVVGICAGDKAVVCGVMGGRVKNAVHTQKSRLFIKLVFDFTTLGYLDNCNKVGCRNSMRLNVMPNVHGKTISQKVKYKILYHLKFIFTTLNRCNLKEVGCSRLVKRQSRGDNNGIAVAYYVNFFGAVDCVEE